jgi:hypothetical protein
MVGDGTTWSNHYNREKLLAAVAAAPKYLLDAVSKMRDSLVEEICPPVCTRRRIARNQDFGDELNAEQVLTRSLTPWERMTRVNQPRRSVTIGVNLSVDCHQKAAELLWRGAAAAALADILTQRGVNVEIVAFWSIEKMSSTSSQAVGNFIVKRADMPMEIGAAALALSEIAYARLVGLFALARHAKGRLDRNFGYAAKLPASDRKGMDYVIDNEVTSEVQAAAWLRACTANQESQTLEV